MMYRFRLQSLLRASLALKVLVSVQFFHVFTQFGRVKLQGLVMVISDINHVFWYILWVCDWLVSIVEFGTIFHKLLINFLHTLIMMHYHVAIRIVLFYLIGAVLLQLNIAPVLWLDCLKTSSLRSPMSVGLIQWLYDRRKVLVHFLPFP